MNCDIYSVSLFTMLDYSECVKHYRNLSAGKMTRNSIHVCRWHIRGQEEEVWFLAIRTEIGYSLGTWFGEI